ncbi:DUF4233 domain-containing protein [Gephyromycinifex aptenodytis]|uniref:DUF4233 domain-containing protein n=1 Tax=Gephyromycinifex aptenodytis TaxID=2716227 RepID=UPI001445D9B1|nr:DUF4233 domain-containing protein [Gephyromycinifex aptenodytis]
MASALPLVGVPGAMQRRLAAIVLVGQAPVMVFGALAIWGLASSQGDERANLYLGGGIAVSVLCVLAAGLLRRPIGVSLGWMVQLATILLALLAPVAIIVGVIFGGLWITALIQGHKMDGLTARYAASQQASGSTSAH